MCLLFGMKSILRKLIGKMSDSNAALVERMGVAVRTAYKAIEVLKAENHNLRAENEALRKQLQSLGNAAISTAEPIDKAFADNRYYKV